MGFSSRFQARWVISSAGISIFSCAVLFAIMPLFLGRTLGHDYYKAYYILKDLDRSTLMLIIAPVLIYVLLASLLVAVFKLFLSHKIAGPLFRFEKCAESIGRGHLDFSTRLRSGDQLNGLARAFEDLKNHLDRPFQSAQDRFGNIENLLEKLEGSAGAGNHETTRHLGELEEELAGLEREFRRWPVLLGNPGAETGKV